MNGRPRTCSASIISNANSERISSTMAGSMDSDAVPGTEIATCVVDVAPVVLVDPSPAAVVVDAVDEVVVGSASGLHAAAISVRTTTSPSSRRGI